jgi:hypothetical protein
MSCIEPSPFKFVHAVFFSLHNCPLPSNMSESITLSDEEQEPNQSDFPKCTVTGCTESAFYGYQSSEYPTSCLVHMHPNHIDLRQQGVYTLQLLFSRKFVLVV